MRPDEFAQLERALGVQLPAEYRAALLAYPFPADSEAARCWLLDDLGLLLERNRMWRAGRYQGRPWPPHYVYVGDDGSEEAYFLDVAREPAPVLVANYEQGTLAELAPELRTWLAALARDLAAIEEDERALDERYRNRKWWQFWIRPYPSRPAT